jgi:hypothetical protein
MSDTRVYELWEADHTELVHVLWAHGIEGAEADELASRIMRSEWMKAVRQRAAISGGAVSHG